MGSLLKLQSYSNLFALQNSLKTLEILTTDHSIIPFTTDFFAAVNIREFLNF